MSGGATALGVPHLPPQDGVERFAKELGLSRTIAAWLLHAGHSDSAQLGRFFEPRLADLCPPHTMAGRKVAAERLAQAVRGGEPIAIFGDYDCDGITATAILTEVLQHLGAKVHPLLASRFAGGYGVSEPAKQRILAQRPKVLVTCDCGSSDHESLAALRDQGVDVVVIDHHLVPEQPLPVLAFLNPHQPACSFGYKGLASCGLALSVGAAVRAELGVQLDMKQWLDLVAIGTIADVAPLTGDNRALVKAGLRHLAQAERPGVRALFQSAKIDPKTSLDAREVAFKIAPRLNAPGRMGAPDLALQLLIAKDRASAEAVATKLEQASDQRKRAQEGMLEQAIQHIEAQRYHERAAIVIGEASWNHGIVGIVAGRLAERYGRPVIVYGAEGDRARGSVRGPRGFRLHDALSEVQGVLLRFGGHQAAAGLEVRLERVDELRTRFVTACERAAAAMPSAAPPQAAVELDPSDDLGDIVRDLDRLEPCGEGNPRPVVAVSARLLEARSVSGGHLKLELQLASGRRLGCFKVNDGGQFDAQPGAAVRALGDLRRNSWRGTTAIELHADRLAVQA